MAISLSSIFKKKINTKSEARTITSKEEVMIRQYGVEFKRMADRGLDLPVALL